MGMKSSETQPVLIIGGGRGGLAFVELLEDEELFHVVGIVDTNPDAPALKWAETFNVPVFSDPEDALNTCKPCTAFNLTHDEAVSELAAGIIGPSSIIGGFEAHLIWKMVDQVKDARDELQKSQVLTESIVRYAMEGIVLIDTQGKIKTFNPAAETMFGFTQAEVIEKNISMLMPEPDRGAHDGYMQRYMSSKEARVVGIEREVVAMHKSGRTFPISLSVNDMIAGEDHFFVGIVSDITERKKNEVAIQKLAHFDVVTGLPNRALFFDRVKNALAHAKRRDNRLAVLFLDLDGFKGVNDTLGHVAGDVLLKEVGVRLLESVREGDTVARFGGDEYALVLCDVKNQDNVALIAKKIIASLSLPFTLNGEQCNIGGSIGVAMFPDDHTDMESLINQADTAMYSAKKGGKNHFRFYDKSMEPY